MMRDNYAVQAQQAQRLLARQDLDACARRHGLAADGQWLYLRFCAEPYRVRRADGAIFREDGSPAGFSEVLSICDLLTRWDGIARLTGQWATVYSLPHTVCSGTARGPADSGGSTRLSLGRFCQICDAIGTPTSSKADASYLLPIFGQVQALAQFWAADEEFPAKLQLLWDRGVQAFLRYETIFYVAGHLARRYGLE